MDLDEMVGELQQQLGFDRTEAIAFLGHSEKCKQYARGEKIVEEGVPGEEIYYLVKGEVRVVKHIRERTNKYWGTTQEGNFFGEAGLADYPHNIRTASVEANQPSIVLHFLKEKFYELFPPGIPRKLFTHIISGQLEKLRERGEASAELYRQIK